MKIWALLVALIVPGALFSQQETASAAQLYYAGIVRKGPSWSSEQTPDVLRVNQQQARSLCGQAPALRSGRLAVEVHPWQIANEILVCR